jgi:hypothetical protein
LFHFHSMLPSPPTRRARAALCRHAPDARSVARRALARRARRGDAARSVIWASTPYAAKKKKKKNQMPPTLLTLMPAFADAARLLAIDCFHCHYAYFSCRRH